MPTVYKLISNIDEQEIANGETVTDFRGDTWTLAGFAPPRHAGSTGRVYLKDAEGHEAEYFPGVINARITEHGLMNDPDLTAAELDALHEFAAYYKRKGKNWKEELAFTYWYNARLWTNNEGKQRHELHALRNRLGPSWLATFKLERT